MLNQRKSTRIFSVILALLTILSTIAILPVTAAPAENATDVWDGTAKTKPEGSGTKENPYRIANGENLAWMSDNLPQGPAGKLYYRQTADIDLGGHDFASIGWQFVGSGWNTDTGLAFYGNYNGQGYTIANAKVVYYKPAHSLTYKPSAGFDYNQVNSIGLFGAAHGATFRNMVLRNITVGTYNPEATEADEVYSTNYAGVLCGAARDLTVENVMIDSTCSVYGGWAAGGFVGYVYGNAKITSSINNAVVVGDTYAGGFVGLGYGMDVSYCINNGKITVDNRAHTTVADICLGGITGTTLAKDLTKNTVESYRYCVNGASAKFNMSFSTARTAATFRGREAGILGQEGCPYHKYLFSHCYNLMTTPINALRAETNSSVLSAAICGQVQVEAASATMEYCKSVGVNRTLSATMDDFRKGIPSGSNTDIKLGSTYPLAGLVNGQGDAGSEQYWNNEVIATNEYGVAIETLLTNQDVIDVFAACPKAIEVWDGTSTKPAGTGTEADPYQIANGSNLSWMAYNLPQGEAGKLFYVQTADIDLGGREFPTIGWQFVWTNWNTDSGAAFYGNYNGQGYTISNAQIVNFKPDHSLTKGVSDAIVYDQMNSAGLFGAAHGATLKNIHLRNITVGKYNPEETTASEVYGNSVNKYKTNYAGVLLGAGRDVTVENCSVDKDCSVAGGWAAGGIIGYVMAGATVKNCINNATVVSNLNAGGIIGLGLNFNVTYCVNEGALVVDNRESKGVQCDMGGIIGTVQPSDKVIYTNTVAYCLNGENATLKLTSTDSNIRSRQGGIMGEEFTPAHNFVFSHCYNLMASTIEGTCPAGSTPNARQGAILGQVAADKTHATMEYCQSVALNRKLLTVEGQPASDTDIKLGSTYPLAGLVTGQGDAGSENYWNNEKIETNAYGVTAESIKAGEDYEAIIAAIPAAKQKTPLRCDVCYIGCQESAVKDNEYSVRLIATVDSLNYKAVGFIYSVKGTGVDINSTAAPCKNVYSSLTGADNGNIISYTAEEFGGKYLMALTLAGLNTAHGEVTIQVMPYYLTVADEVFYGEACEVIYNAGTLVSQSRGIEVNSAD